MSKKKKRAFTKEFKEDAVRLYRESGKSIGAVADSLGIFENSLRRWVQQADIDEGKGPEKALTSSEKAEVQRLKRELKQLREENEFLKKASAYFAKAQENSK